MQAATESAVHALADVTLVLDLDGVIREAKLSSAVPSQDLKDWIGRRWLDTVVDPGSAKVRRIVDDARSTGVSAFRQVNQRFPSGLELPIEYTAFRNGRKGLIAVGKSLQAVAELQSRLLAAQQAIERDYWKLRDVETRCRLLFDRSNEAVVVVRASNMRIVEANPVAMRALGLGAKLNEESASADLLSRVDPDERSALETMLGRVRDQGKAPGILLSLGAERRPWLVRASLLPSQEGLTYIVQLAPADLAAVELGSEVPIEALIERSPDGFVVLDANGQVLRANRAFLDMVQVGDENSVLGERLSRWLGRPGADLTVLLANVVRRGAVRLFSTTLQSEVGVATEVEVSASGDSAEKPRYVGVSLRDVGSRLPEPEDASGLGSALASLAARIGKTPLPALVKEAVEEVERHYVRAALDLTAGNRTAAAQLLGVSRQSLYAKLNRYGMDDGSLSKSPSSE